MTEKIIFPTPRISTIFTEHLKFVCTFFCSCYTKSFNFNSAHIEFPARKFISLQQGRFSTRHHILWWTLFWATQAESLNILRGSERTARKMKDAGLKFNLRGRPPRNSGRSIWRDPEENGRQTAGPATAHKSRGRQCRTPAPFFILRWCAWKETRKREPNQPYYSHEAKLPKELAARSDSRTSLTKTRPLAPLNLGLSTTGCALFDFALTQSVAHYLVCSCVI